MNIYIKTLLGLEEKLTKLEQALANHSMINNNNTSNNNNINTKQEDETSSDGGIESGTEADDFSEK